MKGKERHQLKENAFVHGFQGVFEFVKKWRREFVMGGLLGGIAGSLVAALGGLDAEREALQPADGIRAYSGEDQAGNHHDQGAAFGTTGHVGQKDDPQDRQGQTVSSTWSEIQSCMCAQTDNCTIGYQYVITLRVTDSYGATGTASTRRSGRSKRRRRARRNCNSPTAAA